MNAQKHLDLKATLIIQSPRLAKIVRLNFVLHQHSILSLTSSVYNLFPRASIVNASVASLQTRSQHPPYSKRHTLIEKSVRKRKMKIMKPTTLPALSIASLALVFSACGGAGNTTTTNNSTTNTVNKSTNTAVVTNSNQTSTSNANTTSNASPTPASDSEAREIQGKLDVGATQSSILYVGAETGDYAGYCFSNDSEAGRAILAACKDEEQCAVVGTVEEYQCKVPGLEADLSDSGRIAKVKSVKSLGRKK